MKSLLSLPPALASLPLPRRSTPLTLSHLRDNCPWSRWRAVHRVPSRASCLWVVCWTRQQRLTICMVWSPPMDPVENILRGVDLDAVHGTSISEQGSPMVSRADHFVVSLSDCASLVPSRSSPSLARKELIAVGNLRSFCAGLLKKLAPPLLK